MTLRELIEFLKGRDPDTSVTLGFSQPHSYRGIYTELAFEKCSDTTVGAMQASAKEALGTVYCGWKGGEFTMGEHVDVYLVEERGRTGEEIGPVLLGYMLGDIRAPAKGAT